MSDTSFGSGIEGAIGPTSVGGAPLGGGASTGGGADVPSPSDAPQFGSGFGLGPNYRAPDPKATALDQTADTLQQRVQRANSIAANPVLQFFDPEGTAAARNFVPQATEQLQKIKQQKADMLANRVQAQTLGLDPGEVPDEASLVDRMAIAQSKALKGDLKVFKGIQAVDPKAAEAIQDQVHEAVAGHLSKAQYAFDSLAGMQNEGQYRAKVDQLRKDGTLTDLEALGLKLPKTFDQFNTEKAREGQALREARIGVDTIRQKLEDRNTYIPMEEKEAKTYAGRIKTVYGDEIPGTWSRNGASNTRGLVVSGMADPRTAGPLATPEQRKGLKEDFAAAVPKEDMEKFRNNTRLYGMATTDSKGRAIPSEGLDDGKGGKRYINDNPNVQQGIAEGLAAALRGGLGGATAGLLNIETSKRGAVQSTLDALVGAYGGAINTLKGEQIKPYLTQLTQKQQRDVLDYLKTYNDKDLSERSNDLAKRAGALRLDASVFGFSKGESSGPIDNAIKEGRDAQIAADMTRHQAIGGGDGVLQIGAQRPGAGATALPPGTTPTNQLPGAQPLATPVQQASPSSPGAGNPPPVGPSSPGTSLSGGGTPTTIGGQSVPFTPPPGATPAYLASATRIESGNVKNPWTATTPGSSASGAYQMIDSTWAANKPPGAPARAKDATPEQQTAAMEKLTASNAASLKNSGLPVNDTTLYVAHNLGAGGASSLLSSSPTADARSIVGEDAAKNNPMFFKGRPTVATVLQRYQDAMNSGAHIASPGGSDSPSKAAASQSLMDRVRAAADVGQNDADTFSKENTDAMTRNAAAVAPAALGTLGAVGGAAVGGLPGGVAGGAAGGGAGQSVKDYLLGNKQDPKKIAEEAALSGVFGIVPEGRPLLGAAMRVAGAGGVEAGAEAAKGGDAADVADAGLKGAGSAVGGELFGRALGMIGHKVWSLFSGDAKKTVQTAAKSYSEAAETLRTEEPKLPGANGASSPNPKFEAAEAAKEKAERTLKDAGLVPEEAAYAHKVSSEGVPAQEAQVAKPGALEKERIGAGYRQLEDEVGKTGVGAVKETAKPLQDGPITAVVSGKVSAEHKELAERTEAVITAPAKSWQDKWTQLKDARSALLDAERDALTSTETGRSQTAKDMRTLADTVRTQQQKAAKYVFGEKDGEAFMGRLKVLDTRYRNLMDVTNGMDLGAAARLTGEQGRDIDRKFRSFAHDDPQALAAWNAMRGPKSNVEKDVRTLVGAEKIPYLGRVISFAKMAAGFNEWVRERAAGSPVKFNDILNGHDDTGRKIGNVAGPAGARAATMGDGGSFNPISSASAAEGPSRYTSEEPPWPPGFGSSMSVGSYAMPRAGRTSDYKVKGKDK